MTAWRPVGTVGEEITLTWADPFEIGGVELVWDSTPPDYDILLTRDGHAWSVASSRREARAPLQTEYFSAAPASGLKMRIAAPSKASPAEAPALARIEFKAPEEQATPIRQYQALARDFRPGFFPRWLNREQEFWTTAGLPGEPVELLITESGVVEPRKGAVSVQLYLWHGERLITGADAELEQRLEDGFLPIPQVRWLMPGGVLDISAVLFGEPGNRWAAVRYRASLRDGDRARLGLAVRPVSVVPAWQHAGFAPIYHLSVSARHGGGHGIDIHGTPAMFFSRAPESVGATAGVEREAAFYAERGIAPPAAAAMNRNGLTSALAWFDLGENRDVVAWFPIDADGRVPDDGWLQPGPERVDALFEEARREWRARLGRPEIDIPERRLIEVMKSNLGYILINRDAPWFKPGPRNYNHAWMRDGSLTAAAVLRCGFTNEVRDFITAFAAHVRGDGWVPWMILESGAPVGFSENLDAGEGHEYDSQGQFAFIVREYFDFTGDERLVRALYPTVISAMRFAEKLRSLRLTGEFLQDPVKRAYRGILPASNSHEGYYPARHSYWDGYWLIRGLKDALALAERFGEREDAEWLRRFLEEYRDAHDASMRAVMEGAGLDALPGSVELADFDPTSTSIGLIYADELPFMPVPETINTYDRFWRELSTRFDAGAKRQYTPYEVRNADAFLRLGWRERAVEALRYYLRDAVRPPAWNHMAEVVHSQPRLPAYIGDMPHTWVGADYIRAVLALFAFEEGDKLVVGAGIDPAWIETGIRVKGLRTRLGSLSYSMRRERSELLLDLRGDAKPAGGIEVRMPKLPDVSIVQINGRRLSASDRIMLDDMPEDVDAIHGQEALER